MLSFLAVPAAALALGLAHPDVSVAPYEPARSHALAQPGTPTITSSQAASAMSAQIRRQAVARLRGGFHAETLCSGQSAGQQAFSSTTRLSRWRCTLELAGSRFPSPCRAQADVFATKHGARVSWLAMSRYCRDSSP
jgi:hypothetical protein